MSHPQGEGSPWFYTLQQAAAAASVGACVFIVGVVALNSEAPEWIAQTVIIISLFTLISGLLAGAAKALALSVLRTNKAEAALAKNWRKATFIILGIAAVIWVFSSGPLKGYAGVTVGLIALLIMLWALVSPWFSDTETEDTPKFYCFNCGMASNGYFCVHCPGYEMKREKKPWEQDWD